jgi:uncharacterized SAM-binding protein YcdF (DUF218 family)
MRSKRLSLVVAAGALAIMLLSYERAFLVIGNFLVIEDELKRADLIHVIAGPNRRMDYAVQIYKQGMGKRIFFTGGLCDAHGVHAVHSQDRAVELGIPPQAIEIDSSEITSTYSEVLRVKEFIEQSAEPIKSVIVVSDPHHMRRARLVYKWLLGQHVSVQMAPVPFGRTPHLRLWWTDIRSQKMVQSEYLKIAYYYARYRFASGPLKEWLVSLDRE